jgi:hypothetical protein
MKSPEAETVSGRENLKQTGQEAMTAARERAGELRADAEAAVGDLGEAAQQQTEAAKGRAAEEISRTAEGLETAADELEGSPLQQDLLREAAGGLKQISQAIEGRSIAQMTSDLSDFARRNPLGFLSGAALAGFALARFARAGRPATTSQGAYSAGTYPSGRAGYSPASPPPYGSAERNTPTSAMPVGTPRDVTATGVEHTPRTPHPTGTSPLAPDTKPLGESHDV